MLLSLERAKTFRAPRTRSSRRADTDLDSTDELVEAAAGFSMEVDSNAPEDESQDAPMVDSTRDDAEESASAPLAEEKENQPDLPDSQGLRAANEKVSNCPQAVPHTHNAASAIAALLLLFI